MRKFLLLTCFTAFCFISNAQSLRMGQNAATLNREQKSVVLQRTPRTPSGATHQTRAARSLSAAGNLNSQKIGTAGNLLTIIEGTCNQIDVNDSLNVVTFIHRNDPSQSPGTNVAQYRYDISYNRGNTWSIDKGPITNDPLIDNVSINGRFPQAAIYNPAGNNVADSAYLIYSGTWHDNNTWSGQMRGRGKLSGDTSTFNVNIDPINNKRVAIAAGFCKGEPGVFWNVNRDYSGTFTAGSNALTNFLIIQKGVWNTTTKDVDWTQDTIHQTFSTLEDANGALFSAAFALNIAFDPTGQYGWVALVGDVTLDQDSVFDPVFWKTVDFGATWSGPIHVDLDNLTDVVAQLGTTIINGNPSSGIATSWDEADLIVDYMGNPHFLITVGNGGGYSIQYATFDVWDITYNANPLLCAGNNWNGWSGIYIDSTETLDGTMTGDATPFLEGNRPLASRSEDGTRLFFFWNDSDFELIGSPDNDVPNLFTKAFDLIHFTSTEVTNLTAGDSLWGGETMTTSGGVFGGAIYPTVSPTALKNGTAYNVPLVLTQIDYNNDPTQGLGSSEEPAGFWYVNNINFEAGDFSQGLAADVAINGSAVVTVILGNAYTEDSATITYLDTACYSSGPLTLVINNNGFNPNVPGTYTIYYLAVDANGNVYASDSRTVIVGAPPVADFQWTPSGGLPYRFQFIDGSSNNPASWVWNFGDGGALSSQRNPIRTFTSNGTFNVCLTASNAFGVSAQVCKLVTVTGVGIDEPEFAQQVSVFPNPTAGKTMVTLTGNALPEFTLSVYNVIGEAVVAPVKYKAGTMNVELDLSTIANGVYIMKLQSEKGSIVRNLTVAH